ncbi:MAG TPA: serine hydrolase domain-containing protein [Fimbriimonas sp.]|nr:serine hydrolase domain-containing protein [Fimbriimonas sp.]
MPLSSLLACLTLATGAGAPAENVSLDNEELKAAVAFWLPDIGPCAMAFSSGGKIADLIPGKSIGPAMFPLGSITKTFTAVLVMKMVELKLLNLTDKLSKFNFGIPGDDSITVEQLLTHTSGLPDYFHSVDPASESSLDKIISMIRDAATGSKLKRGSFFYSNTNYFLLGEICAEVGKAPLGALFQKYVCDPLDIKCQPERLESFDLNWYGGAGDLEGTVQGAATFAEAVSARDERLLRPESWALLESPHVQMSKPGGPLESYGYGTILSKLSIYSTLSHGGTIPENKGVDPFVSMLISRDNARLPMGFVAFTRTNFNSKNLNALYGAFEGVCATVDLKRWIIRFCNGVTDSDVTRMVAGGEIDPELGKAMTAQSLVPLRREIGTLKAFVVQAESVKLDSVTLDGVATGSAGTATVSARFGDDGRLLSFGFK